MKESLRMGHSALSVWDVIFVKILKVDIFWLDF